MMRKGMGHIARNTDPVSLSRVSFFVALILGLYFSPASAEKIQYESGNRRDPFFPLISADGVIVKTTDFSGYHVEGIIYDQREGSMALVNGEYYREGENVRGAILKKVHKDRVILVEEDEEVTLWLNLDTKEEGDSIHVKTPS